MTTQTVIEPASTGSVTVIGGVDTHKNTHGPYPRILDTGCDYAAGCSVAAWPVS